MNKLRQLALKIYTDQLLCSHDFRNHLYIKLAYMSLSNNCKFKLREFINKVLVDQQHSNHANHEYIQLANEALAEDLRQEYIKTTWKHGDEKCWFDAGFDIDCLEASTLHYHSQFPSKLGSSLIEHLVKYELSYLLLKHTDAPIRFKCSKELKDCFENSLRVDRAYVLAGYPHTCGCQQLTPVDLTTLAQELRSMNKPLVTLENFLKNLINPPAKLPSKFKPCSFCFYLAKNRSKR